MDSQKVDMFLMTNGKNFKSQHLPFIRQKLMEADESKWILMQSLDLKETSTALLISIFVGHLGIDRFYIGDTGLGIAKLLTCGGMGIWTLVDWFLIQDATRDKNMEKLQACL